MNCKICGREAQEEEFCMVHLLAYHNLQEKFEVWRRAVDVSWSQFLVDIQKNSLTGVWAKEVAMHLILEETKHVE
jgi:hypothetical protein